MRKELVFAILAGIIFGLVVAFGIYRFNVSTPTVEDETRTENTISPMVKTAAPEPKIDKEITITKPFENEVFLKNKIQVIGLAKPNSNLIISTSLGDTVTQADNKGAFSQEITLNEGINEIVVSVFDNKSLATTSERVLALFTSSITASATPTPSPTTKTVPKLSATVEPAKKDETLERIAEIQKPIFAYIGTITDISPTSIQINRFSYGNNASKSGNIQQIAINNSTIYFSKLKDTKSINQTDLAIGDFIIAFGYKGSNTVLDGKKIITTPVFVPTNLKITAGKVTGLTKTNLTLNHPKEGSISFDINLNTKISFWQNSQLTVAKTSNLENEALVLAISVEETQKTIVRRLLIVK